MLKTYLNTMKYIKYILFFLVTFVLLLETSFSEVTKINDVKIIGNTNVSESTILNIAGLKNKKFDIEIDKLNDLQKKIFESNFFSNVELKISNNILNIKVYENPLIDYLIIEGLENNSEFKKAIEDKIFLRSDVIFSEVTLNKDILYIKDFLSSQGYLKNNISYLVKKIDSSRVNVFLKIDLKNKFSIKNIFFIGDKKFSSSKLISVISSSQESLFSFFSNSSIPSSDRLNYDISKLKNFYLSEGYFDVQISNASITLRDDSNVDLTFSINSGNKFILSDFTINKNLNFLKKEDLVFINKTISAYINKTYSNVSLNKLKNDLLSYLVNKNILTNLNYLITKTSNKTLLVEFNIEEIANKKIISNIVVTGNDITEERVIRNNIFFSEGDVFVQSNIDKSVDLLKSLNIFNNVDIVGKDNANNVSINISIEEKPTGEISGGLSLGSSFSSITFNVVENNFFGQGIKANIGFDIGTQQILGNINFSNPDFYSSGNTVSNNIYVTKTTYSNSGYENKIIGDNFSIKYEIFKDLELENGFSLNLDSIHTHEGSSSLIRSRKGDYLTTKYFYNFISDKRNKKFQPTSGYTFVFGQGISIPPSDIPSLYNNISGSFYKEISEDFIGTIKYRIKSMNSLDGDPVKLSDRIFFTDSEVRGFAFRGIGPKVEGDFIGGNYAYSSTFSTTVPNGLPETWKASTNLFLDVANVWGADFSGVADSNKIRSSIGVGLSWFSPIGPISFSYAEPISKNSSDNVEKFNFKLGGVF